MASKRDEIYGKCHLKICKTKTINITDARVDVRAFSVTPSSEFNVAWESDGCAMFHQDCFDILIACSKGRDATFIVKEKEVSLAKEAMKHAEYHDSYDGVMEKAKRLATMLKECKYPIAFTGAGISTSAGIGDFRGIHGKWTENDKTKQYGNQKASKASRKNVMMHELRPTYTHEAILKLMDMGFIKFLISQNTDGLHILSGIPPNQISELHGNAFMEKCEKCNKRFPMSHSYRNGLRDPTITPKKCDRCGHSHRTGRRCPERNCNGCLMNTIINFSDYLENDVLNAAEYNAKKADMVLVLGSTLQVSPANSLVEMGAKPTRLVLCNRQGTPYDDVCYIKLTDGSAAGARVYGDCDDLMRETMANILPNEDLKRWEEGRAERLQVYDERRGLKK